MMRKEYILSNQGMALQDAKIQLEENLGIVLEAYSSDYHGGDYFKTSALGCNVVLQCNFIEDDGEKTEDGFPDASLLLYINGDPTGVDRLAALAANAGYTLRRSQP